MTALEDPRHAKKRGQNGSPAEESEGGMKCSSVQYPSVAAT